MLPCLVILPRCEVRSDSCSLGVMPAQLHKCRAEGKRFDIADLGHEDRRFDWPDPVQSLDSPVAAVVVQLVVDLPLDHDGIAVEDFQQVTQRAHPQAVDPLEGHVVQQFLATRAEHVAQRRQDADLGHHRVHLDLS